MAKVEPLPEYLDATNNIRHYQTTRFAMLTIFIALVAGLINIQFGGSEPLPFISSLILKLAGLAITLLYFILHERTMLYWRHFVKRASELEQELGYRHYSSRPPAGIFSGTNAVRMFFIVLMLYWIAALIWLP